MWALRAGFFAISCHHLILLVKSSASRGAILPNRKTSREVLALNLAVSACGFAPSPNIIERRFFAMEMFSFFYSPGSQAIASETDTTGERTSERKFNLRTAQGASECQSEMADIHPLFALLRGPHTQRCFG